MDKDPDAFRTISEVADDLDIPQHVLRFWETRFAQIKPMKRSGGRRYYRPDDVDLLRGIRRLLYGEGYTIRGVQRILKEQGIKAVQALGDLPGGEKPSFPPVDEAPALAHEAEGEEDGSDAGDDLAVARAEPPGRAPLEPAQRREAGEPRRVPAAPHVEPPPRIAEADRRALSAALDELIACRKIIEDAFKGPSRDRPSGP